MTLCFVTRAETFSVYTRNGLPVFLPHGRELLEADLDAAREAWALWSAREYKPGHGWADVYPLAQRRQSFRLALDTLFSDAYYVASLEWCASCDELHPDDYMYSSVDGQVCDDCRSDQYSTCYHCGDVERTDTTNWIGDETVCERCTDSRYMYCGNCAEYCPLGDPCCGDPMGCDGCEAEHLSFALRNNGYEPLRNDVRAEITLPAGTVDEEGLRRITTYVRDHVSYGASYVVASIGDVWQSKEGNYTRRLSRAIYKATGEKLTPAVMSELGNIGSAHAARTSSFSVELSRDLNLSAEAWGNSSSCWWEGSQYGVSRCAFKASGGFGLRDFDTYGRTIGRVWVQPLDSSGQPTHDTDTAESFVVFNAYGSLEGYIGARIIAYMTGLTYKRIGFTFSPAYVNNNMGVLVAAEPIDVDAINLYGSGCERNL